ncbi:hypothetical protein TVAG_437370 [Trichomonas vaginalis G3]|uniref:Uncharacterized protein n=1 Tax=Trichomonas vaginalis (strain ATCC PRA-98 / G3) TaxID=412133 RepID=A2DFI3_TRIV3|nr:mitogen-activated protein family [Trichomonas vaginalis G3]EAY20911.1 hypothetical protein TVAG_437370 [Trichomonas vaginalis G3]KAI5521478.1 mitogen-activated protein family [Trichomonas vaginalis G3]|eukprot:XP_001581897.1 hypothetical protein [Trichomonas vaginalis G3]
MEPILEKVVGSGIISSSVFTSYSKSGVTAIACGGILSIFVPKSKIRYDYVVDPKIREITALAFSPSGTDIAIAESGPNSTIWVVSFSDSFDKIISTYPIKTAQNGFSYIGLTPEAKSLVEIDNEEKPFLYLWDLTTPNASVIGYYHLSAIPKHLHISFDGKLAIVSGEKLLQFINIQPKTDSKQGDKPVVLQSRSGAKVKFKDRTFVASAINPNEPNDALCLTNYGTLVIFEKAGSICSQNTKLRMPKFSIIPVEFKVKATSLAIDNKIILIGTETGSILAVKKDATQYVIFGRFSITGKSVVAITLSKRIVSAAYSDGSIIFWLRKIKEPPLLTISNHSGSINATITEKEGTMYTAGSDGTIRIWDIQEGERICKQIIAKPVDFNQSLTGIRCIVCVGNFLVAGDFRGTLHVLSKANLNPIQQLQISKQAITAIASNQDTVVCGTDVGKIITFQVALTGLIQLKTVTLNNPSTVTSLLITDDGKIIAACADELRLFNGQEIKSIQASSLSLSFFPNKKYFVSACNDDNSMKIIKINNFSVFRSYNLANGSYPVKVSVEPSSGLFISACMSDSTVRIVDSFSGEQIYVISSMSSLITDISYISGNFVLSSFQGFCGIWRLPEQIHNAIKERTVPDVLSLLNEQHTTSANMKNMRGSIMRSSVVDGMFEEAKESVQNDLTTIEEAGEEEDDEEQNGSQNMVFDQPRPSKQGQYESKIDNIVRASFIKKSKKYEIEDVATNLKSVFQEALEILNTEGDKEETKELRDVVQQAQRKCIKSEWFKELLKQNIDSFLLCK